MTAARPPRIPSAIRLREPLRLRVATLERELARQTDPQREACIRYEIGSLLEHDLGDHAAAKDHYRKAIEAARGFRPAVNALLRIAEQDPDSRELGHLYEERFKDGDESMSLDLALWRLRRGTPWHETAPLLTTQLASEDCSASAAVAIRWLARQHEDAKTELAAVLKQRELTDAIGERAALSFEAAIMFREAGLYEDAVSAFHEAATDNDMRWVAMRGLLDAAIGRSDWQRAREAAEALAQACLNATDDTSDPFALPIPAADRKHAGVAYLVEAAAYAQTTAEANLLLDEALVHAPDADWIRRLRLLHAGASGDYSADIESWFAQHAADDPAFAGYRAYRVFALIRQGQPTEARALARQLVADSPATAAARAAFAASLIAGGDMQEYALQLELWAAEWEGEAVVRSLWKAANLLSDDKARWNESKRLYKEAIELASDPTPILRDAYGTAIHQQRYAEAADFGTALLEHDLEPVERSAIRFMDYEIRKDVLAEPELARASLEAALQDPACHDWAGHLARVRGAWDNDLTLLAFAHESLAERKHGVMAAAHWCAAARARLRNDELKFAENAIRRALHETPGNPYATNLFETLLRRAGRADEILALRRQTKASGEHSADAEMSILLAGWSAQDEGRTDVALRAYQDATKESPNSVSPWLGVWELGVSANHQDLVQHALKALGSRENGSLLAILHAAEQDLTARNLDAARAALASIPSQSPAYDMAQAGLQLLEPTATSSGNGLSARIDHPLINGAHALVERRHASGENAHDGWMALSDAAPDGDRHDLALHGLRAWMVSQGVDAIDDTFLVAQELGDEAHSSPSAAVAIDEVLAPGDDPELRARAVESRLSHASRIDEGPLEAAYARVLIEAGRYEEANALLTRLSNMRPDDASVWESLREAARKAKDWPTVARACERLATFVDGPMRAALFEEAGIVRLDLDQEAQAIDLLALALKIDPQRATASRTLRRLWAEQDDVSALIDLATTQLEHTDDEDSRVELLYERCRLLRSQGDRAQALEAVESLLQADPTHVGGLALSVEIHAAGERWQESVDGLKRLARADIPPRQKRIAHLGAADFLVDHLHDHQSAMAELREVERLGLRDAALYHRLAEVALAAEAWEDAVYASDRGAQLASGEQAARFAIQGAALRRERLGDDSTAIESYRQALRHDPTCHDAVRGLVELLPAPDRNDVLDEYRKAVWRRLEAEGLSAPLFHGLRDVATWQGDSNCANATLDALVAVGLADDKRREELASIGYQRAHTALTPSQDPGRNQLLSDVLKLARDDLARMQGRTLRAMGVGRRDRLQEKHAKLFHADLEALCQQLNRKCGQLFVTKGDDLVPVEESDGRLQWVIGQHLLTHPPGPKERFRAARAAWAIATASQEFVDLDSARGATLLRSLLEACDVSIGGLQMPDWPTVDGWHDRLRASLSRKTKQAIKSAVGDLEFAEQALSEFVRNLRHAADEAALGHAGDLRAVLEVILGSGAVQPNAVYASSRCMALLRVWMRPSEGRP